MIRTGTIGIALASALALLVGSAFTAEPQARRGMRRDTWRLSLQTYTFNQFTLFEAIEMAKKAGIRNIEAFPGQKVSADGNESFSEGSPVSVLAKVKNKLDKEDIRLLAFGVTGFNKDEAAARRTFDFAKLMGIETITAEPELNDDVFKMLDKLVEEYRINIAIHNHPKDSTYWNPDTVLKAIQGHSPRIGACADTGHWMRSGINPLEAIKKLEGHIVSSHFKDLNEMGNGHDVIWGTGKGDAKALLTELHRQGFKGVVSIEYEHNWGKSLPEVEACAKFFNELSRELNPAGRQ